MKQSTPLSTPNFREHLEQYFTKIGLRKTYFQLLRLLTIRVNPAALVIVALICLGIAGGPIVLLGALLGYVRGYNREMRPYNMLPSMWRAPKIVFVSMAIGAIALSTVAAFAFKKFLESITLEDAKDGYITAFLYTNVLSTLVIFGVFQKWRTGIHNMMFSLGKHATARFAEHADWEPYLSKKGFYIGGNYTGAASDHFLSFPEKGHILTVAGARSGKSENVIVSNLLGVGDNDVSWVCIDVKGELVAVCGERMRERGYNVYVLNPWDLLSEKVIDKRNYNPLDMLADKSSTHLVDDVSVLAEMICPTAPGDKNSFFTDSARNIISTFLLHLVTCPTVEKPTLELLWTWLRKSGEEFDELLADMAESEDPVNGEAVRNGASEIAQQIGAGETFSSIMATVLLTTNFLKSSALRDSLHSDFDPYTLANGEKNAVFIVIPADKLKSHAAWLRLVVTSLMRAIIRKPGGRVCFLADEAASLGPMSEFQTCLATYSGYNVTLWQIFQDLNQIKGLYGDAWQTVMANSSVQHIFGIRDNFTAQYVSEASGDTTVTTYKKDWLGFVSDAEHTARKLVTPDEARRMSKDNMFLFINQLPVSLIKKAPYYRMPGHKTKDGQNKYQPNPYIENSL